GLKCLAALNISRCGSVEDEVDLELAVADLRINLGDLHPKGPAVDVGRGALPDRDATEIIFVNIGLQLVATAAVDLPDAFALLQRLAELDIEAAELPGDRCADLQLAKAAPSDPKAAVH